MSVDPQTQSLPEMARAAFARDPAQPIVEFEQRWYTWGDLRRVAGELSTLIAQSGAGPRAAIAFAPRNSPQSLAAMLGLIAESRTIEMVYVWQSGAGIARDLERLKPSVFVASPQELGEEVRRVARELGIALIELTDMNARGVSGFERTSHSDEATALQILILTSGTTGAPKQFPIPYELITNVLRQGTTSYATHGANLATMPPVLLFFPIGNITGIYSTVPTLILGTRMVLLERFTLDGWRDHVRRYKPAHSGLPAAAVQMVLDADVPREELAGIKSIGTGAAPVDPAVQRAFEERYGVPILLAYGATEFGGRVCSMTAALYAEFGSQKLGSVGRPIGGAKIRVIDPETGDELPANREGIFEVVSPHMGPGWIRTTDLGIIDEDGFVFHRARADGAIMRGGFKVLPESIESALALHPAVASSAVVGIADRRLGQVPAAAVQLRMHATSEELEAHLRQHVPATHIPTHWRIVDELPRNASMKVDRLGVKKLFEG